MIMLDEQDQFVSNGRTQVKIQPGLSKNQDSSVFTCARKGICGDVFGGKKCPAGEW
jgi:hypothetical protein